MSFAEKIASLMARPNQQPGPADDQPWYLKYGVRILGITGAFFCILFGLINALYLVFLNVSCAVGGILEIIIGFLVMVLEAPCCFFCIDYVSQMADLADSKPMYYKAALYCAISIIPVFFCLGLGTIFPCALVFGTGVIYGMMGLGKKATREDMAAAATSPTQMQPGGEGQMQMSTDQHITLMEDPDVWRPT